MFEGQIGCYDVGKRVTNSAVIAAKAAFSECESPLPFSLSLTRTPHSSLSLFLSAPPPLRLPYFARGMAALLCSVPSLSLLLLSLRLFKLM